MEIVITALKEAVIEADTRARILLTAGRPDAAEATYETLLAVLNGLLSGDELRLRGWQRTVYTLTDTSQRLAVDALAVAHLAELQTRIATLLDLPALTTISGITDFHDTITATINVGAPRYNSGDIRGCCTVYWATIHTMASAPAIRGFPGYARVLGQLRAVIEAAPPPLPLDAGGIDDYAWSLRGTLDAVLAINS